jgi:Predicted membrane protein (DUF2142)
MSRTRLVTPARTAFALLATLFGLWMWLTPPGESPDETSHLFRVGAVASLHPFGQRPASFNFPGATPAQVDRVRKEAGSVHLSTKYDYLLGGYRNPFDPTIPAPPGPTIVLTNQAVVTNHARTQIPPYVLPAIVTLAGWSPRTTFYLARLGFVLQNALVLTLGIWAVSRPTTRRARVLVGVGVLIGLSPLASYLSGMMSPSALEVAGSISLTLTTWSLCKSTTVDWKLRAAWLVALGAAALSRSVGPGVALVAVLLGVFSAEATFRRFVSAIQRKALGGATLILLGSILWDPLFKSNLPITESWLSISALRRDLRSVWLTTLDCVDRLGWLDIRMPLVVRFGWFALGIAWLGYSIARGGLRWIGQLLAVAVLYIGIGVIISRALVPTGFGMQGRYLLPMLAAFPVAACLRLVHEDGPEPRVPEAAVTISYAWWFVLTTIAMLTVLRRYTVGSRGPIVFFGDGEFAPPLGYPLVAFAWLLLGAELVMIAAITRRTRQLVAKADY